MRTETRLGALLALALMIVQAFGFPPLGAEQVQLPDLRSENIAVIALSLDGRFVATGERATVVKLWDARTRRLERTLRAHNAPVSSLAFSPNGQILASGGFDEWIRLWDVTSGQATRALGGHPGHVKSLAFTRDGKLLASSGADGVRLWDVSSGSLRMALPSPRGVVAAVFSPDGTVLASAGGDGVKLWDVATGTQMRSLDSGTDELILALAFSPDGRRLATGGTGRTAKLWDMKTGELNRTSDRGNDFVRALAFSGDGSTVVIADRTAARAWETGTGTIRPMLNETRFTVVAISSDGETLGAAVGDEAIKVLSLK